MQKWRSKKIIAITSLLVVFAAAFAFYYWDKIELFWTQPQRFIKLFLDASQLSKLSLIFVISTLIISIGSLLLDLVVLGWEKSSLKRLFHPSGSAKNDLWSYFLSITKLYEVLAFICSFGVFYFLASIFVNYFNLNLGGYIINPYLQFCVLFLVTDFKHYIGHRFMHLLPFWELHAYHHSAEEFNLITTSRGHIIEAGVYYFFSGLFFAIFGGGPENLTQTSIVVFSVITLKETYQYILHSDVNWKLGWVGKYILISPLAHKLHHSIYKKDYNKNYGNFFIWWDLLLKTYKAPKGTIKIGIEDNPYNGISFFKGQWIGIQRFFGKSN